MISQPTPIPRVGEVLIKVEAIGVNFSDTLIRQNRYAVTPALPAVPGIEVAGTIASVGKDTRALPGVLAWQFRSLRPGPLPAAMRTMSW
jgi:NADPH:quinone reductase